MEREPLTFAERGFPRGPVVRNLPATQETWVRSLDWEDPLEEGMATHSSILARRIPWTEEPGGLQSMGSHTVGHDRRVEENKKLHPVRRQIHVNSCAHTCVHTHTLYSKQINFPNNNY